MRYEELNSIINVSRETYDKLSIYYSELEKFQRKINLISNGDLDKIWTRHIIDSLQVANYIKQQKPLIIDLGSGGGLPGLILAAKFDDASVHMVESDQRKCSFLRHTAQKMGLHNASIHNDRIEDLDAEGVFSDFFNFSENDVDPAEAGDCNESKKSGEIALEFADANSGNDVYVTARALASLDKLCEYIHSMFAQNTKNLTCLFSKGKKLLQEIKDTEHSFDFKYEIHDSLVDDESYILEMRELVN